MSVVFVLNFILSLRSTFRVEYSHRVFLKYSLFLSLFSILNYALTQAGVQYFGQDIRYEMIFFVTTLLFFVKFFVYHTIVFKK